MVGRVLRAAALVLAVVVAVAADASAATILATVDRNVATPNDRLVLTVTIEGTLSGQPQLPELSAFDARFGGRTTQVQSINGRTTRTLQFTYLLFPQRIGSFTIGPVSAQIDGELHQSRPFQVQITAADARPRGNRELFLTANVSTTEPYVSEQVIYTLRFYRKVRVGNGNLEMPEFDGFLAEELGEQRDYESAVDGVMYAVSEFRRALFPQEAGTLTIEAAALDIDVILRGGGGFFFGRTQTRPERLRAGGIELNVKPLPAAPAGFSGLVGSFALQADLSRDQLAVGESATLNITVRGTGNVHSIPEPIVDGLDAFKVYDDKPSATVNNQGNALRGTKSYAKALVPMEAGDLTIPPVKLVFFDPDDERYRTSQSGPFQISVAPSADGEVLNLTEGLSPGSGKVAVRVLGDDILPIYRRLDAVSGLRGTALSAVRVGTLGGPPLMFAGLLLLRRRQESYLRDGGLRRRRSALKNAVAVTGRIASQPDLAQAAELSSRALRGYIGDKLGLEGGALTTPEAVEQLGARGVPDELLDQVRSKLMWAESVQYGMTQDDVDLSAEATEIRHLLKRLERFLR